MLLVLAATTLQLVAALNVPRPYEVWLTDQDTLLKWDPAPLDVSPDTISGGPSNAWNVSYSQVPWSNISFAQVGEGYSWHGTSVKGATLTLDFVGTDIAFYGFLHERNGERGSVSLSVDGKGVDVTYSPAPIPGGPANVSLLAATDGKLVMGTHTAVLTVEVGYVGISNISITTLIDVEAKNASKSDTAELNTTEGGWVDGDGDWFYADVICHQDIEVCDMRYPRLVTVTDHANATFSTSRGASYMQLIGDADYGGENYRVQVSPSPPFMETDFRSSTRNPFFGLHSVLFQTPLDPSVVYNVSLIRDAPKDPPTYLNFHSVRYVFQTCSTCEPAELNGPNDTIGDTSDTSDTSNTGDTSDISNASAEAPGSTETTNVGAIAGGIVGGVIGLTLLLGLFFLVRRRRRTETSSDGGSFDNAGGSLTRLEPLRMTPESGSFTTSALTKGFDTPLSPHGAVSQSSPTYPGPLALPSIDTAATVPNTPISSLSDSKAQYRPQPSPLSQASSDNAALSPASPIVAESQDAGRLVEWVPPRYNEAWRNQSEEREGED